MNDLGGALRELAREAQAPAPVDPGELWAKGRQRVRRRRAIAGVVVVVLALLAGSAALLVPAPTVAMPAGPAHDPALPKNIYTPSRWLVGTDDKGPLGQVAVLGRARQGSEDGVFAISATTGEYRFLDLARRVRSTSVALSPDGTRVAYWITGRIRGRLYGNFVSDDDRRPVTGLAVYNTVDGSVVRRTIASDHGLDIPSSDQSPIWLDDSRLLIEYGFIQSESTSNQHGFRRWDVRTGEYRFLADDSRWTRLGVMPDESLVGEVSPETETNFATFETLNTNLRRTGEQVVLPAGNFSDYSRSGGNVVITGSLGNGGYQRARAGRVGAGSRVGELTALGMTSLTHFLGWRSPDAILMTGIPAEWRKPGEYVDDGSMGEDTGFGPKYKADGETVEDGALYEADVRTHQVRKLGTTDDLDQRISMTKALLPAPMVHGLKPPRPLDPRLRTAGLLAGSALLCAVGVFVVRRRRRA